jgi:hypothetical protein
LGRALAKLGVATARPVVAPGAWLGPSSISSSLNRHNEKTLTIA